LARSVLFIYLFISLIHQQSYQTVAAKGIRVYVIFIAPNRIHKNK